MGHFIREARIPKFRVDETVKKNGGGEGAKSFAMWRFNLPATTFQAKPESSVSVESIANYTW
jgi:hypothetical protein